MFSCLKDMFINIIFTGKLCYELFTSPVLFTGDELYFRGICNSLDSFEKPW
jgi:hypothetical protein